MRRLSVSDALPACAQLLYAPSRTGSSTTGHLRWMASAQNVGRHGCRHPFCNPLDVHSSGPSYIYVAYGSLSTARLEGGSFVVDPRSFGSENASLPGIYVVRRMASKRFLVETAQRFREKDVTANL